MGEVNKGNCIMKLFNWLRGMFRKKGWTPHGKIWADFSDAPKARLVVDARGFITGFELSNGAQEIGHLRTEIARLKRNKKKHSRLQKELDALIDRGADTQTNNGDNQ